MDPLFSFCKPAQCHSSYINGVKLVDNLYKVKKYMIFVHSRPHITMMKATDALKVTDHCSLLIFYMFQAELSPKTFDTFCNISTWCPLKATNIIRWALIETCRRLEGQ